ncbi:tyrosine-protein phosphatase [Stagnihabitans tardus]|uniref:Protein-tyrosine-phosphatase n=1 Tax=Stagnihabitans tardus TaxID=2699202 RepID=A0AAE5BUV0_9RHOB|nr:tyrosine-protein phosphatase [Stagnihabitans tardus]NBZ87622.1 protein-tyrosine-phosphatase [Stagnihabitans tardus]
MTARSLALPFALTRRALMAAVPASFLPRPGLGQEARPQTWAPRVLPEIPGLPNLHHVAPNLYRAAQPDAQGFAAAEKLGIWRVISLRQTVRDAPLAEGTGLDLVRVPMKSRHVAERDGVKVVAALRALRLGMEAGPVLVHCHHGADRTGLICALYRLLHQGWSRQEAIDEMTLGGFGYHPIWANIPRYLWAVDLGELRERVLG